MQSIAFLLCIYWMRYRFQLPSVSDNDLDIIERFVVKLYTPPAQNTSSYSLASVRLENFLCSSDNVLTKLPPSREALRKQAKRSCFQSGYLWVEAVEDIPLPDASLWGWILNENKGVFLPLWQSGTCSITIDKFTSTCRCQKIKCKTCKSEGIGCIPMCGCKKKC